MWFFLKGGLNLGLINFAPLSPPLPLVLVVAEERLCTVGGEEAHQGYGVVCASTRPWR
jgi:hypothetical protein